MKIAEFLLYQPPLVRYGLAIAIFSLALFLRFLLIPVESGLPYITFFPALVIGFYLCGIWPGTLMVGLSTLAAYQFFMPRSITLSPDPSQWIGLIIFLISAYLISQVVKQLQNYAAQLRDSLSALKQSEQYYLGILEHQTELLCRLKADGTLSFVNDAFCRLFGKSRESIIGYKWHPIPFTEDVPMIETKLNSLSPENPAVTIENRVLVSDGSLRWVQFVNRGIYDAEGHLTEIQSVGRDITERKESEQQLNKLAQAIEQCFESVVITNQHGEIEYVNQAFVSSSGYTKDDVMGENPRFLNFGKTPNETFTALRHANTNGLSWKGELVSIRKDGTDYVEFAKISPIIQADGRITHFVEVKEDITERKRIATELNQHRHHLEKLVASKTLELLNAREVAETASRAKSAFLANMSHEIRTPLNAIIGLAYLLRNNAQPDQEKHLTMLDGSAQHLLSIISDILDISKIEAGKIELEQIDFTLAELVYPVQSYLTTQAQLKHLLIEVDLDDTPDRLHGDLTRLRQALLNYANNAIKFTERGTIRLRVKLLLETEASLLVRFEIQDTGIGIQGEKLPFIFDAFVQADVSNTRQYGGSGLGLAITRSLANIMGGDAGVDSALGQGSTFWFTARLKRGQSDAENLHYSDIGKIKQLLTQQHSGAKLLVVEDDLSNRQVIQVLLKDIGILADTADNGRIAVEMIFSRPYDLVLMDIQMPEMDGLEATRTIRAFPKFKQLPILALTGNALKTDLEHSLATGFDDFLTKPITSELLYEKILYWLNGQKDAVK